MCIRDRFELKRHLGEPGGAGDVFQHALRLGIPRGVIIDKMHRTAQNDLRDRSRLGLHPRMQMLKEPRQHLFDCLLYTSRCV